MTLPVGTKFGPYEVLSLLGVGGMGEVYKALDPKLDRMVAIKVLARHLVDSDQAMVRFRREAKAVAALSHPNILGIYDFGEQDGLAFAVTEFLDGQSLRELISKGPLPARRCVEIARQIAEGLAAAHEKGIVHRDLKPDNVFIMADGTAKILDFGLAKQIRAESDRTDLTLPASEPSLTSPGMVVGTTRYMSPEQARGNDTDARSDIFSFGIVVWEMLSGQHPFKGDSILDTLQAIIKTDPPELAEELKIPSALERLLRRCLNKRPEDRIQSAKDLAFHLESLSSSSHGVSRATMALPPAARRSRILWISALAILGVAALSVAGYFTLRNRYRNPAPPVFQAIRHEAGIIDSALLTPDGSHYVFGLRKEDGQTVFCFDRVEGGDPQRLQIPSGARLLAISPTGEIALLIQKGDVMVLSTMPLDPQAVPREVMEHVTSADFDPVNSELSVISHAHLADPSQTTCRIEHPVGRIRYESRLRLDNLSIAPDGKKLAFVEIDGGGATNIRILEDGAPPRTLLSIPAGEGLPLTNLIWSADGRELIHTRSSRSWCDLLAVDTAGRTRRITRNLGDVDIYGTARDGTLLVALRTYARGVRGIIPGWREEQEISDLPGDLINIVKEDTLLLGTPSGEVMKYDPITHRRSVLGKGLPLEMSPDGKWVISLSANGLGFPMAILPTGLGAPRTLTPGDLGMGGARPQLIYATFFPDNRHILASGRQEVGARIQYAMYDMATGHANPWVPATGHGGGFFAISGDGKRLALWPIREREPVSILDVDTGHLSSEVEFPDSPGLSLKPFGWSEDGRSLFLWKTIQGSASIVRFDLDTKQESLVHRLQLPAGVGHSWEVQTASADGKYYAYAYRRIASTGLYLMNIRP